MAAAAAPAAHGGDQRNDPSKSHRKRRPSEGEGSNDNSDYERPQAKRGAYQCRFCKLSFEKSQALGGHMNRHRTGLLSSGNFHLTFAKGFVLER